MDSFRFLPPSIVAITASLFLTHLASALPAPQFPNFFQVPQTNPNQALPNTLAGAGLGAVGGVAATQCLFGRNCNLSFRPSLGAAVDANGRLIPQLGVTTQVGNGPIAPTFTGGLQLDPANQNGALGGFVAGGVNNGDPNSISPGVQTGFGFGAGANGQTQATAQLGGNIQAPQFGGVNFGAAGRPGSIGGAQPTLFNQPLFGFLG